MVPKIIKFQNTQIKDFMIPRPLPSSSCHGKSPSHATQIAETTNTTLHRFVVVHIFQGDDDNRLTW